MEGDTAAHSFGGLWTVSKLAALEKYLKFYTTALKNQGFRLVYVDAFAGTGEIQVTVGGATQHERGSAKVALDIDPPFHELIFVEKQLRRCKSLSQLAQQFPARNVKILRGDANTEILQLPQRLVPARTTRAVLFLDPYGLSVQWETLRSVAQTGIIDLWYLFPLAGLYRQMAIDSRAIDEAKAASIDTILGTSDWRQALYSPPAQAHLFDDPVDQRIGDWRAIVQFVTARLREAFPAVVDPLILYTSRADGSRGSPLFALYFACSNPHSRAQVLSCRAANYILTHG